MWYSWFIMIKPISVLPHLLNWISYWIDFFFKFLNWIIFWIEFLWNNIELNIELNHFLAKFKYWIESIWVSFTPMPRPCWNRPWCQLWRFRTSRLWENRFFMNIIDCHSDQICCDGHRSDIDRGGLPCSMSWK